IMSRCTPASYSSPYFLFFFFFSSRRRHTRLPRDWSSDVCSSDLEEKRTKLHRAVTLLERSSERQILGKGAHAHAAGIGWAIGTRSEERRVGKECRARWTPYHDKKKGNAVKHNRKNRTQAHREEEA